MAITEANFTAWKQKLVKLLWPCYRGLVLHMGMRVRQGWVTIIYDRTTRLAVFGTYRIRPTY